MDLIYRMLGFKSTFVRKRFHVDPRMIALNREDGGDRPVFVYWLGDVRIGQVRRVDFVGDTRLVYDPENPLPNGSVAWIETDDPVRVSP